MSQIYQPAEDSHLLTNILKKELPRLIEQNLDLRFLEIGAGSGIHLWTANNLGIKKQNIFSCDMNKESVHHCNILGFNCVHSDLFENVEGKFDLIIFNPPYLGEQKYDKEKDTTGGKKGDEVILRFLKQAKDYLEKDGKIFLLKSSLTPMKRIEKELENYKVQVLGKEKLFYEELIVWEIC